MIGYDHPFADGNGRVARALFYWKVLSGGLNLFEFSSLSRILLRAPAQYSKAFVLSETAEGDLTHFVLKQLDSIETSLTEMHRYLRRKFDDRRRVEEALARSSLNHRQASVVRSLTAQPWEPHTFKQHMSTFSVSRVTARNDLIGLYELGVASKRKAGNRIAFFGSRAMVEALEKAVPDS